MRSPIFSEASFPGVLVPSFVQNSHDKDLIITHSIVNLKFKLLDSCLSDIPFDNPCCTRIAGDVLELIADSDHKILTESRPLFLEKSFCALKIEAHDGIEDNALQSSPASNSSREIGLVFPSL